MHCFSAVATANPLIDQNLGTLAIEFLSENRRVPVGETVPVHFKLVDPTTGQQKVGLRDVSVLYFRAPGTDRSEVSAEELGDGVYRAQLPFQSPCGSMSKKRWV